MSYEKAEKHYLTVGWSASNPVDSIEYRFLRASTPLTASPNLNDYIRFPREINIKRVLLSCFSAINYSGEDFTIIFRDGTVGVDYPVGTFQKSAAGGNSGYLDEAVNFTIPSESGCQFKVTSPAWVTNPTNFVGIGILEFVIL